MISKLDANIIIIFFTVINITRGLFSAKVNNLLEHLTASDINKIASKEINIYKARHDFSNEEKSKQNIDKSDFYQIINNDLNKQYNKILIKRIIPHGLKSSGVEYDYKFNTYYKPLIRIHQQRDLFLKDKDKNRIASFIPKTSKLKHFKIKESNDKDIDNELLIPFKLPHTKNRKHEIEFLKNLENIIKDIESRTPRQRAYDKVIKLLQNMLRSPQFEKSGEVNDPFAPGKILLPVERDTTTEKNRVWMPHYPPWNYWTYKKTLHQDICPGEQVKLGNMCIWTPPH